MFFRRGRRSHQSDTLDAFEPEVFTAVPSDVLTPVGSYQDQDALDDLAEPDVEVQNTTPPLFSMLTGDPVIRQWAKLARDIAVLESLLQQPTRPARPVGHAAAGGPVPALNRAKLQAKLQGRTEHLFDDLNLFVPPLEPNPLEAVGQDDRPDDAGPGTSVQEQAAAHAQLDVEELDDTPVRSQLADAQQSEMGADDVLDLTMVRTQPPSGTADGMVRPAEDGWQDGYDDTDDYPDSYDDEVEPEVLATELPPVAVRRFYHRLGLFTRNKVLVASEEEAAAELERRLHRNTRAAARTGSTRETDAGNEPNTDLQPGQVEQVNTEVLDVPVDHLETFRRDTRVRPTTSASTDDDQYSFPAGIQDDGAEEETVTQVVDAHADPVTSTHELRADRRANRRKDRRARKEAIDQHVTRTTRDGIPVADDTDLGDVVETVDYQDRAIAATRVEYTGDLVRPDIDETDDRPLLAEAPSVEVVVAPDLLDEAELEDPNVLVDEDDDSERLQAHFLSMQETMDLLERQRREGRGDETAMRAAKEEEARRREEEREQEQLDKRAQAAAKRQAKEEARRAKRASKERIAAAKLANRRAKSKVKEHGAATKMEAREDERRQKEAKKAREAAEKELKRQQREERVFRDRARRLGLDVEETPAQLLERTQAEREQVYQWDVESGELAGDVFFDEPIDHVAMDLPEAVPLRRIARSR